MRRAVSQHKDDPGCSHVAWKLRKTSLQVALRAYFVHRQKSSTQLRSSGTMHACQSSCSKCDTPWKNKNKKKRENSLTSQILSGCEWAPKVDKNELLAFFLLLPLLLSCVSVFFCLLAAPAPVASSCFERQTRHTDQKSSSLKKKKKKKEQKKK